MSSSSYTKPPTFNLYSQGAPPTADPYFHAPPSIVNLSGKIGSSTVDNNSQAPSAGTSLISTVTSAVETSYQSARNVVFGADGAPSAGGGAFSLLTIGYQQIVNFAICMGLGAFFMFLAFLFLPMVVFAPQKFTLLFTLGSICWISGLAMLQGPKSLGFAMINKERLPFTIAYGVSLFGTFYATLFAHSYILTMLFAVAQITALMAFILSYFPGGTRMLSLLRGIIVERAKWVFRMNSSNNSSVLPL